MSRRRAHAPPAKRGALLALATVAALGVAAMGWLVWPQPSRQLIDRTGLTPGARCEVHDEPFVVELVEVPDPGMCARGNPPDPALRARLFPHASVDVNGVFEPSLEGLLPLVRGRICPACGVAARSAASSRSR